MKTRNIILAAGLAALLLALLPAGVVGADPWPPVRVGTGRRINFNGVAVKDTVIYGYSGNWFSGVYMAPTGTTIPAGSRVVVGVSQNMSYRSEAYTWKYNPLHTGSRFAPVYGFSPPGGGTGESAASPTPAKAAFTSRRAGSWNSSSPPPKRGRRNY